MVEGGGLEGGGGRRRENAMSCDGVDSRSFYDG